MFKKIFIAAFRRMSGNKLSSSIKLISLSAGIICFIFISLFVGHEYSFDRFNMNAGRIVRLVTEFSVNHSVTRWVVAGTKAGPELQRVFPAVKSFVRMSKGARIVARNDIMFDEKEFLFADSTFLKIFTFPLLEGNDSTALDGPGKVILTQSMAKKYFGEEDPLGKILVIGGDQTYMVSGIMKDVPSNSQITFDFLASFSNLDVSKTEDWFPANYLTYLLLETNTDIKSLDSQIGEYVRELSRKDPESSGIDYFTFHLEPLTRVHMYSDIEAMVPNTPVMYIYILVLIAVLILIIACINYINLTIALAAEQRVEIGIRKVLGANKWHLYRYFISETFIITGISAFLAIILAISLLPYFNLLTGRVFEISSLFRPVIMGLVVLVCLVISLIAGSYPAFVMAGHKLISILKPGYSLASPGGGFRKSLIIFQFVVSVILIIVTLVIHEQRSFIQHKNIGYNRENVIYIRIDKQALKRYYDLKNILKQSPDIVDVTAAYTTPTVITWTNTLTAATDNGEKQFSTRAAPADLDYTKTLGIKIMAGSDFTEGDLKELSGNNSGEKQTSLLLNETAVKNIGWTPEEAIGRQVKVGFTGTVKGVFRDFNIESLHEPVRPLVIFLDNQFLHVMLIRIKGNNIPGTLAHIEGTWKKLIPWQPFDYHFLNEEYDKMYQSEQKTARLLSSFSFIAILLACLGLFGMTALVTVKRTKEVGIRKVLGASAGNITFLLSIDFIKMVMIAIVISVPIAWLATERWLKSFAYRIEMPVWVYFLAGLFAVGIALATVSYQSVRAALANPVNSLRNE